MSPASRGTIQAQLGRSRRSTPPRTENKPRSRISSSARAASDERRRKREHLAKLHRFLSSRAPTHIVFGLDAPPDPDTDLGGSSSSVEHVPPEQLRSRDPCSVRR